MGVVFIPMHFAEAAANLLTIDALDPLAKIPEYKACACASSPRLKQSWRSPRQRWNGAGTEVCLHPIVAARMALGLGASVGATID